MTISSGTRLGPYEVLAPLGAGGMGEVYRARDPRLGREVAIKVLPASFSTDPERLRRFQQEARAAGALNHPNLTAVYDIGWHEGMAYVVSELLEGETLNARLAGGPLSARKAIEYALQIARGLAAAHEKGIVHRDLKPENLFITRDGHVKILDFGLARFAVPDTGESPSGLPATSAGTEPGIVLGTLGYMSPEQLRGRPADARSDIFSFGAVLYEMLSGKRAFRGTSAADTISAILREDPPEVSGSNRQIPDALERIIRHCLEKQPEERFRSAHDLAFALEAVSGPSDSTSAALSLPARRSARLARKYWRWILALAAAALAGGLADRFLLRPPGQPRLVTFRPLTYSGSDFSPAASPDGRTIAFASERDGRRRIWLKQLSGGNEVALTSGSDDDPRFSPDGSSILFSRSEGSRTTLYRVPLLGGEPRKLAENASDGEWSPDGRRIVFVRKSLNRGVLGSSVFVAASDGAGARELARIEDHSLRWPRWSPDGRAIALVDSGLAGASRPVQLVDAETGKTREVAAPGRGAAIAAGWSGDGQQLLYTVAVRGLETRLVRDRGAGAARTLLWIPPDSGLFDILGPERLLYETVSTRQNLRSIAAGVPASPEERWLTRGNSADRQPVFSPDGEWVLFTSNRSGNLDIWKLSLKTGTLRRLTEDAAEDWDPVLTRDGKLLWSSGRAGHLEIWTADADGSGARQVTSDGVDAQNPTVTPDGTWVLYNSGNLARNGVWKIHPDGSGAERIVAGTTGHPEVSPDGRYVLYLTGIQNQQETLRVARVADGRPAPFDIRIPIRRPGAIRVGRARWTPDGRAIAFVGQDENGVYGIFEQDFVPGQDTSATRRPVGGFDKQAETESFGISPDGSRIIVASWERLYSVVAADGVSGISPPARRVR
ncbi:MAG TPA: protein kinase [Thermoanaerobaculia bacterium]|nr:protein kinase [Thermoanaerobaculia bacterium]